MGIRTKPTGKWLGWLMAGLFVAALIGVTAAEAKTQFRIAGVVNERSTAWIGAAHFKKRVEALTNGEIEVITYPATLGKGERQLFEALQLGTLEGVLSTTGPLSAFVPEADLFNLPFLFKNSAHAYKVVDGEIGAWFNKKAIAKGFRILGWWTIGARNTSNNVRPINTPADYKGLKIRTMESPPFIAVYKAMGAIPVPMSITEVYTALQQGTIDGIDGSLPAQLEFKHIEVLKYAPVTDHVVLLYPFFVAEKWWQGLSANLQQAIMKAEAEARPIQREADAAYAKTIEAEWIKRGKAITHPPIEPFQKAAESIYPQFYDKVGGKQIIDKIQKIGESM